MKVLNKGADEFIGFHVDNDMGTFLTLLSIIRVVSKSSLLRVIVQNERMQGGNNNLHYKVALHLKVVFDKWKDKPYPNALVVFIKSIKGDLLKKKISQGDIEIILKEFNALTV